MGTACNMHVGDKKLIQNARSKTSRTELASEYLKIVFRCVDWIRWHRIKSNGRLF